MAERENRTLCNTAWSLLFNTDISKVDRHLLWTEAIRTAAYLRNRVPSRGINTTTPYSEWYGKKPDVTHLRVFGAKAFVRIPDAMRHKMDPKAKKMIFVGYDRYTDKIYRVFDLEKKVVKRVVDVTIEDVTDTIDGVLFSLKPKEQEEECEKSINNDSQENSTDTTNEESDDDFADAEEDEVQTLPESPKNRGRPLESKSYQKPVAPTDHILRDRTNKLVRNCCNESVVGPQFI